MESIRSFPSTGIGLPRLLGGSAPASAVSGPARCYCAFGLHDSPSRLKRPSTSEASAASSPPPPLRLLPGGAIQFPGGNFNPRWTNALHGTPTHQRPLASAVERSPEGLGVPHCLAGIFDLVQQPVQAPSNCISALMMNNPKRTNALSGGPNSLALLRKRIGVHVKAENLTEIGSVGGHRFRSRLA
jgi:hypothetical protein